MYLILDRWREKIVDRYSILNNCPKCNGDLHRIRKPLNHKLISYIAFLQIKYYQCKLCDFKGIKIYGVDVFELITFADCILFNMTS